MRLLYVAVIAAVAVAPGVMLSGSAVQQGLTPAQRALLLNPDAPEFSKHAPDRCLVRFDTSKGTIDIEVTRDWSPLGADRFVALVRAGYYNDARFFRVAPGWVQFGIAGDPAIAQAWRPRTFPDDPFLKEHSNVRGTVAFAYAVPNGRTTQIFFNMRDNSPTHDNASGGPFTPFGRVTVGMDVADKFNAEYKEGPGGIRAGKQDAYFAEGNAYLARTFPNLDYIKTATVVSER